MAFYKIKNCDVYYAVLNDNLVDSTIIRQEIEKVDFSQDEDKYCLINTNDGNFKEAVFKPSVTGGQFFGKNIIIADGDTVTVDVFGLSKFHNINGSFLQDKDLPAIDMEVSCSTEHTIVKNKITVDLTDTNMATLSYLWVTGTELDFMASDDEKIRYDFVILKK